MPSMQDHLKECIKICWQCRDTCQDTLYNHILEQGGDHLNPENIRLLTECIEICQLTADFMRRNSAFHNDICNVCADICDTCATTCENMGSQHATTQKCAEICRICSRMCRDMGQMVRTAA